VFVGMQAHGSISQDGVTFDHNTFYRAGFNLQESIAFGAGGRTGQPQTNLVVVSNVFVDIGSHYHPNSEGYINLGVSTNPILSSNFCAAAETMGWSAVKNNPGGISINGGDPIFVNAADPLGPDGLPFTDDDGLRPLPNSPLAIFGLGAEPAIPPQAGTPLAHFSQVSLTTWQDDTTTNFNPVWAAAKPHARGGDLRPWTTSEALGRAPVTVTFSASNSVDGLSSSSTSNAGITGYAWDFGDGTTASTVTAGVNHTFRFAGDYRVTLTVTNSAGGYASYANSYRALPTGPLVAPPPNFRVVGN
jgi:PKD repeat protein